MRARLRGCDRRWGWVRLRARDSCLHRIRGALQRWHSPVRPRSVCFVADDRLLAVGLLGGMLVLDAGTGEIVRSSPGWPQDIRTIHAEWPRSAADGDRPVEDSVAARKERQAIFTRDDRPSVSFVLAESCLHRRVGGPEVMREQLDYLVTVSRQRNVLLQILPSRFYRRMIRKKLCSGKWGNTFMPVHASYGLLIPGIEPSKSTAQLLPAIFSIPAIVWMERM